jgi:hypothetical protein
MKKKLCSDKNKLAIIGVTAVAMTGSFGATRQVFLSPFSDSPAVASLPEQQSAAVSLQDLASIKSGSVVTIPAGVYKGTATFGFNNVIMQAAKGARVVIDGGFVVKGSGNRFVGIEVMNSKGTGVVVLGRDNRFINMIVHDCQGQGFAVWESAAGAEVYGCLIYSNGRSQFEHGIYSNGANGQKTFSDNIIFHNASLGLTLHSASGDNVPRGYQIVGNHIVDNGRVYGSSARQLDLGQTDPVTDTRVTDNVIVGGMFGSKAMVVSAGSKIAFQRNVFVGSIVADPNVAAALQAQQNNAPRLMVRRNRYDLNRFSVHMANLTGSTINVPGITLRRGQQFTVRNAGNYFGQPLVRGAWTGNLKLAVPKSGYGAYLVVGE